MDYPTAEAIANMGDRLAERSNGELKIKLYVGGQLAKEKDTLGIAIPGGIDLARINTAPVNSIARGPTLFLPDLFH